MGRRFTVIVEKDEDGYYVGSVAELPGCHTQAKSLDKLIKRMREAISLYLEVEKPVKEKTEFVSVQVMEVPA